MIEAFQPFSSTAAVPPSIDLILQQLGSALGTAVEAGANLVGAVFSQAAKVLFILLTSIYISLDCRPAGE